MTVNVGRLINDALAPTRLDGVDAQRLVARTYYALRWGLGALAALFPFVLLIGEHIAHSGPVPNSISGYYHTTAMRTVWTGVLVLLGVFLLLYKGFSKRESVLLNIAGLGVFLVVLCPCARDIGSTDPATSYTFPAGHGVGAFAAFGCMGIVAVFLGSSTLDLLPRAELRPVLHRIYVALGIMMVGLPVLSAIMLKNHIDHLFWVETAAVLVFAAYWLVKTWEFSMNNAETQALAGTLADRKRAGRAVTNNERADAVRADISS